MRGNNHYEFQRDRGADFRRFNNFQRNKCKRECIFREHGRQQRFVFRRFLVQSRGNILDGASRVPDNVS
jgi:hypothetical protein